LALLQGLVESCQGATEASCTSFRGAAECVQAGGEQATPSLAGPFLDGLGAVLEIDYLGATIERLRSERCLSSD
jgi:hypothetical protein